MGIEIKKFGIVSGCEAKLYRLRNSNGFGVDISDFGANVVAIYAPDKNGNLVDVSLGYNDAESYLSGHGSLGATVGRYANRIKKGHFELDGKEYNLFINNGENHLHGGKVGYNKVMWDVAETGEGEEPFVIFKFEDGEDREGYPGNLTVFVKFTVQKDNSLAIEYTANTDKTTYVNLTNHSYFNLNGEGNGDILEHILQINAEEFTPTDAGLIPTGEILPVKGTAMDFTAQKKIGRDIASGEEPLELAGGYDHNYVLGKTGEMKCAAVAYSEKSGIILETYTDKPGVQLYTGNFLDGSQVGKSGKAYERNYGFCLETQYYPDSPNNPQFPSCKLTPKETYNFTTIYKFLVK